MRKDSVRQPQTRCGPWRFTRSPAMRGTQRRRLRPSRGALHVRRRRRASRGETWPWRGRLTRKACNLKADNSSCTELKDPKLQQPSVRLRHPVRQRSLHQRSPPARRPHSSRPTPTSWPQGLPGRRSALPAGMRLPGEMRLPVSLGYLYTQGDGVTKNVETGVAYYRKGCVAGDAMGCGNLGNHVRDGDGGSPPNPIHGRRRLPEGMQYRPVTVGLESLGILYDGRIARLDAESRRPPRWHYQKACAGEDRAVVRHA